MKKKSKKKIKKKLIVEDVSLIGIYLITIILIVVIFFTWTYHNRQFKNAIDSEEISQNDISASTVEKVLPIPAINDWIEYAPKCTEFKDYVKVYYPKGWEAAEWNHVTDDPEAYGECQIIFGFPIKPKSYQEPTAGDIAQMRIATVDGTNYGSIESYINDIYGSDLKLQHVTINGIDFVKFSLSDKSIYLVSKVGGRFFIIQEVYGQPLYDLDPNGGTLSSFDSKTTNKINSQFINRLIFY